MICFGARGWILLTSYCGSISDCCSEKSPKKFVGMFCLGSDISSKITSWLIIIFLLLQILEAICLSVGTIPNKNCFFAFLIQFAPSSFRDVHVCDASKKVQV